MKKSILLITFALAYSIGNVSAQEAAKAMSARKNITENVSKDKELTALNDGLKATSMGKKLEANGQFTFFAITNGGFDKTLHGGTPKMMSEEYLPMLDKILNFHTINGVLTMQDLKNRVEMEKGTAMLKTMNGESLKLTIENGQLMLSDAIGNKATIVESDLKQSNGIVHVIDTMLLPQGM